MNDRITPDALSLAVQHGVNLAIQDRDTTSLIPGLPDIGTTIGYAPPPPDMPWA